MDIEKQREQLLLTIFQYRGELFVPPRVGAQLTNDDASSFEIKAFIWFDRYIMRFPELRNLGRHPWYYGTDQKGERLEPLLDFIYDESIWPRHIKKFKELEDFLYIIDGYYHAHCLDDLLKIVDCPRLGSGHLMTITTRYCDAVEVMERVFGCLEHFEAWDFNVLLANGVSSLFQNKTDEMYGEGSLLAHRGFYINTKYDAPFIWADQRKKKETRTQVARTSKVKINIPRLGSDGERTSYLELGQDLQSPYHKWLFPNNENIFDGVILKCKNDPSNISFEPGDEITVDYNFGRNGLRNPDIYDSYDSSEALLMVASKKKYDRRVPRAEKLVGVTNKVRKKALKAQIVTEVEDNNRRRQEKRSKTQKAIDQFEEQDSSVDTEEFFEGASLGSGTTNTFHMDFVRSSEKLLSNEEHEKWTTLDQYGNYLVESNQSEKNVLSKQWCAEADAILKQIKKNSVGKNKKRTNRSITDNENSTGNITDNDSTTLSLKNDSIETDKTKNDPIAATESNEESIAEKEEKEDEKTEDSAVSTLTGKGVENGGKVDRNDEQQAIVATNSKQKRRHEDDKNGKKKKKKRILNVQQLRTKYSKLQTVSVSE